jgi:putative ABC transport system ATP-binding protein
MEKSRKMALRTSHDIPNFTWDAGDPLVYCQDVVKIFKTPAGESTILKGISANVFPGEFVSVVGRSGSGKSTLVNMITGIDHPTSGIVRVAGTELHRMSEGQVAVWRGKVMGIVFQFFQLLPMLTLMENIMLPMDFCNMYAPAEREERAMKLLRRVNLDHLAHKLPMAIAGGQQQSAAVARALANDPPILLADEPTGNLDSRTAEEVMQLFEEMVDQGKTVLMVTHDPLLAKRASRSLIISDGELVSEAVASAFPDLQHSQLLLLSHMASTHVFSSGEGIPGHPGQVYVVSRGSFKLLRMNQEVVETFGTGKFIDPVELNLGRRSGLALVAGETGADLLAFERGPAVHILGEAAHMPGIPAEPPQHAHPRNPFRGLLGWLRSP